MPYLKIQTNITLEDSEKKEFLLRCSRLLVEKLNKPERTIMAVMEQAQMMCYAGSDNPVAFLELKSIGLTEEQTLILSKTLCEFIELELGIPANRVYIEFSNIPASLWGWNGATFAI